MLSGFLLSLSFYDTKLLMHNVHAVSVITLGILNEKEITLFILEFDIIGIISGNAFFTDKHRALVPMRAVLRGIENKALESARSAVKNINAVNECSLRITNAFGKIARLKQSPSLTEIMTDRMIHLLLCIHIVSICVKDLIVIHQN